MFQFRGFSPVPHAADAAVVLAYRLVELDTNPRARATGDLLDFTHIHGCAPPGVVAPHTAPLADLDAAAANLLGERGDLGLLAARAVGVEPTQLLGFLPCEDGVGLLGILVLWQNVLIDARGICVIRPSAGRSDVDDLC